MAYSLSLPGYGLLHGPSAAAVRGSALRGAAVWGTALRGTRVRSTLLPLKTVVTSSIDMPSEA